jgi:hypothetical protein
LLQPDVLPFNLKSLYATFNECSTRSLNNVFPASLETLDLSGFNQQLHLGVLPTNLKTLNLHRFNFPISINVLPASLTELDLSWDFNHPLNPGVLPASLRKLTLGLKFSHPFQPSSLPTGLTDLHIEKVKTLSLYMSVFPSSLEILGIPKGFTGPLTSEFLLQFPMLRKLIFGCTYSSTTLKISTLPPLLKSFKLCGNFPKKLLPNCLPNELEELEFDRYYSHPIDLGVLPDCLKTLRLSYEFDEKLKPSALPSTLERLECSPDPDDGLYDQPFEEGVLPESLKVLVLSPFFSQTLDHLPSNLQHLYFTGPYTHQINPEQMPLNLQIHSVPVDGVAIRPYTYLE